EGIRSTANLAGGVVMEVTPSTTPESWQQVIRHKLERREEAAIPRFMKCVPVRLLCWFSLKIIQRANRRLAAKRVHSGRYRTSGIISNLGLIRTAHYQGGGFMSHSIFFIPPDFDTTAFF